MNNNSPACSRECKGRNAVFMTTLIYISPMWFSIKWNYFSENHMSFLLENRKSVLSNLNNFFFYRAHRIVSFSLCLYSGTSISRSPKGLGKLVLYMANEGSFYGKPWFDEFSAKQPKCSLYRGLVNSCCFVFYFLSFLFRCDVSLPSFLGSERLV